MVYPLEKILKIVASFSRFPSPPPPKKKMPKILFFLLIALKKSSERGFETHLMLKIAQITLEICF